MIPTSTPPRLILASSSAYRRELLGRLRLPFEVMVPDIDETALPGEAPDTTALRLARAKAQAVAARAPGRLAIGSDQVATLDGEQIGKPGNHANALAQLQKMRGRKVVFHTALCLWDSRACVPENDYLRGPGKPALQGGPVTQGCGMPHQFPASPGGAQLENIQTLVTLRDLPDAELDAYLRIEQPYDCAGSAKNEGLGIAIIERIDSSDPTALTGLPLIALTGMLRKAGFQFFRKEQD